MLPQAVVCQSFGLLLGTIVMDPKIAQTVRTAPSVLKPSFGPPLTNSMRPRVPLSSLKTLQAHPLSHHRTAHDLLLAGSVHWAPVRHADGWIGAARADCFDGDADFHAGRGLFRTKHIRLDCLAQVRPTSLGS